MTIDFGEGGWGLKDWISLISATTAMVALVVSYVVSKRTLEVSRYNSDQATWQKANETELKAIELELASFYGPLLQKGEVSRLLSRDLRARQTDGKRFLLLVKLFDAAWIAALTPGEKALVDELVANANDIRAFTANRSPSNAAIIPYLARADAHYRVLALAAKGQLGTDPTYWKDLYVFPPQVDQVLALEVARLERRASWLRAHPGEVAPPREALEIPKELALKPWVDPPRDPLPELNVPLNPKP